MKKSRITLLTILAGAATLLVAVAVALPEERTPIMEGDYAGTSKCKMCHMKEYKGWEETAHAKAFDTLPDDKKADAACLTCHTTGANAEDPGVGCEMCHGPGQAHIDFMKENRKAVKEDEELKAKGIALLKDGKSNCYNCHLSMTHGEHPPK